MDAKEYINQYRGKITTQGKVGFGPHSEVLVIDFMEGYHNLKKKEIKNKRYKRFNAVWDWSDFSIGFSIARSHECTGWKLYISLELGFLSVWIYFYLSKFYDKTIGFQKPIEITEEEIAKIIGDNIIYSDMDIIDVKIMDAAGAILDKHNGIEYGHYDGQRFPIGTKLTSKENGELIIAPEGTPNEEIVHTVKADD